MEISEYLALKGEGSRDDETERMNRVEAAQDRAEKKQPPVVDLTSIPRKK